MKIEQIKKLTKTIITLITILIPSLSHAGTASINFNDQNSWLQQNTSKTEFVNGEVRLKTSGFSTNNNTKVLMHGNSLTDSSSGNLFSANGTTQVDTTQSKLGGASLMLNGTTDYLSGPDSNNWNFEGGDFTIDMWIRPSNIWSFRILYSQYKNVANRQLLYLESGVLKFYSSGSAEISFSGGTVKKDTWQHIALVRNGNTLTLYIDGVSGGSKTVSESLPDIDAGITIGKQDWAGNEFYYAGNIEEIAVHKVATWNSNFSPPQSPYETSSSTAYITTTDTNNISMTTGTKISSLSINNTQPASTNIKALVSFDKRATWKKWSGSTWTDTTLSQIHSGGMTIEAIQAALAGYKFANDGSIDLAFGLESTNSAASPSISGVTANYSIYKISNISIAGSTSVSTLNSNITYTASATKQDGTLAFEITLPNGSKVNSNTANYSFAAAGNYTLTAKAYVVEEPTEFKTTQINITVTSGTSQGQSQTGTQSKPKITANLKNRTGINLSNLTGITLKLQNLNGEVIKEAVPSNYNNLFEDLNKEEIYKVISTKTTTIPVIQNGNINTVSHITKTIRFDTSDDITSDFFIDEPKASNVLLRISGIPSDWTEAKLQLTPITSLVTMDKNPEFTLTPSNGSAELIIPEMPATQYKWSITNQDDSQTFGGTNSPAKTVRTNTTLYFHISSMKAKTITNIFKIKNADRTDGSFNGETINIEIRDQNNAIAYTKTLTTNGPGVSDTTTELTGNSYTVSASMDGKREMSRTVKLNYGPKTNTMTFTSLETIAINFIVRDSRTGNNLSVGSLKIFDKNGNITEEKIIDGSTITASMVYGYPYKVEAQSPGYSSKTISIYPRETIIKEITLFKR